MSITICVYHDNVDRVWQLVKHLPVGLEFQGFGFTGSKDPESWSKVCSTYIEFLRHNEVSPRALHGPFFSMMYQSQDYLIQQAVRQRVQQSYDICKRLNVHTLVQHFNTDCTVFLSDYNPSEVLRWTNRFASFWRSELDKFRTSGIQVVMENVFENSAVMLRDAIDSIGSDSMGFCLDVGHANCFSKTDPLEWIEVMGHRLTHLHLHQNDGSADQHLPLTAGPIDIEAIVKATLEHSVNPNFSIEVDTEPEPIAESAEWLCKLINA